MGQLCAVVPLYWQHVYATEASVSQPRTQLDGKDKQQCAKLQSLGSWHLDLAFACSAGTVRKQLG